MNIIELTKDLINSYIENAGLSDEIHIDYTEDDGRTENTGIFSIGDIKVNEDVLGNPTRRNSIVVYLVRQALEDCERLENTSFLLNMANYFDSIDEDSYDVDIGSGDNLKTGKLKSIACSNAMLYGRSTDTGTAIYQVQLQATYKLYI